MEFLVSPKEAIKVGKMVGCVEQLYTVMGIAKEMQKDEDYQDVDKSSLLMFMMQIAFNAGRMYGVRNERARRKAGAAK